EQGMIFGSTYASAAVISDGTAAPALANAVTDYVPSGRPGGRAPHVWLERDGARISTIDLVGKGFVLLTGPQGKAWQEAAERLASDLRFALKALAIRADGIDDPDAHWRAAYGLGEAGAVLVRPDGYVGWRSPSLPPEPMAALRAALTGIL